MAGVRHVLRVAGAFALACSLVGSGPARAEERFKIISGAQETVTRSRPSYINRDDYVLLLDTWSGSVWRLECARNAVGPCAGQWVPVPPAAMPNLNIPGPVSLPIGPTG